MTPAEPSETTMLTPAQNASTDLKTQRSGAAFRPALLIAGIYLALSVTWILVTDRLLYTQPVAGSLLERISSAKGILFVMFSALLIYTLVRQATRQLIQANRALQEQARRLEELNAELTRSLQTLKQQQEELQITHDAAVEGWTEAMALRDDETHEHTRRVAALSVKLGRVMGMQDHELREIHWGGLLHDIGKMAVPDSVLLKPGKLTREEYALMQEHPVYARRWLEHVHFLGQARDIPYFHHEKWDGTGYPHGLKGEEIPLYARIFAIVDVYDALTSDRPYRKAMPQEEALGIIEQGVGTHFDPEVAHHFLQMVREPSAFSRQPSAKDQM
ncbi:HD-GYP domain-containing protein [Deinococcus cellulosilyticus]|uniref:HD-GYP domain-containing protein n=1 Tax=Deinococcus cellulosilyticus (strain DSM 18568 / NBRC 106333 / KACC 11606 / 5516J-15) TaxID=1223518 RepID=A0A511N5F4_DEIC1|nr:HD-GYP domain-containing protein [Deinococcus cellulosilyticus]GEM47641.1 hypothetical protein DC3_32760 [Deinococcus cellulosilyticus NBRC 106333 = KACC 11606]